MNAAPDSSVIAEKDLNVRVTPNGPGKVTLTMGSDRNGASRSLGSASGQGYRS
jgi:hypothetical protein